MNFIRQFISRVHQTLENPGTRIKGYAKTLNLIYVIAAIVSLIAWAILGIDFCTNYYYSYYSGGYSSFNFWMYLLGFLGIIIAYVGLYITCVFLAAFGELVENSSRLVELKSYDLQSQISINEQELEQIISQTLKGE